MTGEPSPTRTVGTAACCLRADVTAADRDHVRRIVESTGFFRPDEVDVAVELVDERLARGVASGYEFVFADREGRTVGYACYGPIACTIGSYDLYWIAVDRDEQGTGLGRVLLAAAEDAIRRAGGRQVYIETSNRPQYVPTRGFYERCGYRLAAVLPDFYAPGDDKVIFVKILCRTDVSRYSVSVP
jgi:GNAT superfamily N-acetyltransferase